MAKSFANPSGGLNVRLNFSAYSAFVRSDARKVLFRYYLEGYDKGWVNAGQRRMANYTNIPPGRYRFKVIAANEHGEWSDTGTSVALSAVDDG